MVLRAADVLPARLKVRVNVREPKRSFKKKPKKGRQGCEGQTLQKTKFGSSHSFARSFPRRVFRGSRPSSELERRRRPGILARLGALRGPHAAGAAQASWTHDARCRLRPFCGPHRAVTRSIFNGTSPPGGWKIPAGVKHRRRPGSSQGLFPPPPKLAELDDAYGRASSTILNGVSAARRTRVNPAPFRILESRPSPACAPSPSPTSCESEAGVHNIVEAP